MLIQRALIIVMFCYVTVDTYVLVCTLTVHIYFGENYCFRLQGRIVSQIRKQRSD
jgi:hypothetical protein